MNSQNCRSVLTRLGFTVHADPIRESEYMTIEAQKYKITAKEVRKVARNCKPESIKDFYVDVEGKRFPPKQLIRLVIEKCRPPLNS